MSRSEDSIAEKGLSGGSGDAGSDERTAKSGDSEEAGAAGIAGGNPTAPDSPGGEGEEEPRENAGDDPGAERRKHPHGRGGSASRVQKRSKRATRKELLELISRKNKMLQDMDESVEKAKQEVKDKEDRLLRLVAEFENFKKRTRREWELLQERANAGLIKDLLGVLDDFDRALESVKDEGDHFQSGVRLIYAGLSDILKQTGLREIESLNQSFNPLYHEAIGEIESGDVEEGNIAQVVQKGYMLNDELLRPAKVLVAKRKRE